MKKIIYAKYNSLRKTEFQIKTSIIEAEEKKYVMKEAMNKKSEATLHNIKNNYELLARIYEDINFVPCTKTAEGLRFEYIDGEKLYSKIDAAHDNVDAIIEKLKVLFDTVLDIKDEYIEPFEMSDRFKTIFGECEPQNEDAFKVSNICSFLSDFIDDNGKIWCVDYEWVFDFDIPVNYIIYRNLYYFFEDNKTSIGNKIDFEGMCDRMGLSVNKLPLYSEMEEHFREYVYGENSRYMYVNRYLKPKTTIGDLEYRIHDLEKQNQRQAEYINKVQKIRKNPFYIFPIALRKIKNKKSK